jgi:hypothetical protein
MKPTIFFFGLLLGVAAVCLLVAVRAKTAAPALAAASPAVAPVSPAAAAAAPLPPAPSRRPSLAVPPVAMLPPAVQREVETAVPTLHSEGDVDRYLAELQARARRQGRVTAVEVEPGVQAIAQLEASLPPGRAVEKLAEWQQQMSALSRELQPPAPAENPAQLLTAIGRTHKEEARQELIARYLQATASMSPEDRLAAQQQLDQLIHSGTGNP